MSLSAELKAIVTLLEDTDPVVEGCVDSYLMANFSEIEDNMPEILMEIRSLSGARALFEKMSELNVEITLEKLDKAVREYEEDYVYEWFLVNRLVLFSANYDAMYSAMLVLAAKAEKSIPQGAIPEQKITAFNRVFFEESGFEAMTDKDIPFEALLPSEVLVSRKGIPLVLDMIYVFLADMLGFPLKIYVKDDGFIAAWTDLEGEPVFFIDMGRKGKIMSVAEVAGGTSGEDICLEDISVLNDIYAVVMSDIFTVSGEKEKSVLMMKAHEILAGRQ